MHQTMTKGLSLALVLALFFVSGALALVYEVVWSRMMMQVFGSTAIAVGTVLAAFMSGMATGSWFIGRFADSSRNCLRLYACLEAGIGLAALVSHLLLARMGPAHLVFYDLFGASAGVFAVVRFLLAFLAVMAPTILMGATLPVLTRFLVSRQTPVGIDLSTLYATNTLGAVTGVLLTGFFLIGRYGIHVPVYMAIAGNLSIGIVAWFVSRRLPDATATPALAPEPRERAAASHGTPGAATVRIILMGLGISGFTSFAYEIYWTRSLVFVLGNSTYALTAMLSAFLTGIALGGYLVRFFLGRARDLAMVFGWLQVLLGIFSALALPLLFSVADPQSLNEYVIRTSDRVLPLIFTGFGVAFLVMLVPAVLIGATFPLAGQIAVAGPEVTGASVGRIYAINTLGNVLGALLPGLILLDWLGIQRGILLMAGINVGLGLVVLGLRLLRPSTSPAWRLPLPAVFILAALIMSRAPLQFQFPSDGEQSWFETLFYREGPLATTKVYRDPRAMEKHMSVDRIVIGGTGLPEYKQLLLAHLPKLLLEDVATELTVGLGSGMLAGESALHPGVDRITAVEIEPGVVDGAGWFAKENHDVLDNPRVTVIVDDIGNFLRTTTGTYQVITADEKTADDYASNGFSYSLDYYRLLRDHLAPGGIVAQWVPTTLPPAQYRMVLNTFAQSFPHMQLWYFLPAYKRGPFNSILIGSNRRITIDYALVQRRLAEDKAAFHSLERYGLTTADALLPHFVADEAAIRDAVGSAPLNSLDHPRYEFFYPWDYALGRQKFIRNHELIRELRRVAHPAFRAGLEANGKPGDGFEVSFAAEGRYLTAFQRFLTGVSLDEMYRLFDGILSQAPANDSLRAQVYSVYSYVASVQADPMLRRRLLQRANALYSSRD